MTLLISLQNYPFIHVIFLPIVFILFLFSNNQDQLIIEDLFIPLIFAITTASILIIIVRLLSKNFQKNSLILSMMIILFFVYGHTFITVDNFTIDQFDIGRHLFLLPLFSGIFVLCLILIKKYFDLKITFFVNIFSIILIVISISNIATFNILYESDDTLSIELSLNPEIQPNVYYIILDEYAGKETLKNYFAFDNSKFLDSLRSKGFFVASDSYSNYPFTNLSTASTLNMNYVNYLTKYSEINSSKPSLELYQKNNVMKIFNDHDYNTIYVAGGVRERVQIADVNVCERYMTHNFPNLLFKTTLLTIIHTQFVSNDWREIRLCAIDELSNIHENYSEPFFVFSHLRLPHDPFTFGPDGQIVDDVEINLELNPTGKISHYLDQLEFTNKKISEIVDILLESENPPVIIIQSDHGARFAIDWESSNISDDALHRGYNNLYAVYFPNQNYSSFNSSETNVNVFRIMFNDVFGEELDLLEDKIFLSTPSKQYEFEDITKKIFNPSKIND